MSSVRTNFPFSSQDYDEIPDILSLEKGEVLTDVLLLEGGWWYGKKSSGELGYFPCSFVSTIDYCEDSVIENIETCGRGLILIEFELPQPPSTDIRKPSEQSNQQKEIPMNNLTENQSCDRKVISDVTGWLRLKDDQSGNSFYFKDGEYAWCE